MNYQGKVTIGIFTYDRPGYLRRQLSIFKDGGQCSPKIILDGSSLQINQEQNKYLARVFDIPYIHQTSFFSRIEKFSAMVDTDYVSYCPDDDVFNPSYYASAVKEFEGDIKKKYSILPGRVKCLQYFSKTPFLIGWDVPHLLNEYDISEGDFIEKICRRDQAYMMGCTPSFYAVRRSSVNLLLAKNIGNIKTFSGMERLATVLCMTEGGMKVIDSFMGYRDYSSPTTRDPHRDDPKQYIPSADIDVIAGIIKKRLEHHLYPASLIDYAMKYAWPLPMRRNTGEYHEKRSIISRGFNMLYNQFLSDERLIVLLRRNQSYIYHPYER
jgi:glycosyltransferase domain-containing protein